jgi:tape measure domain-containing protein
MSKLGKSSAETDRALTAIAQMMSKGVVSAEEMRGQLGEALPGAMQAAAKGAGLTVEEFGKLMETGTLMAEDVLPGLARELSNTFKTDDQAESFDAQLNRIKNTFTSLLVTIGDAGAFKGLTLALSGANMAATGFVTTLEMVGKAIGVMAAATASMDFSGIDEAFEKIGRDAAAKITPARDAFLSLTGAVEKSAAAVAAAGAEAATASSQWARLTVDYTKVDAAVKTYVETAREGVAVAKAQADAGNKLAAISGEETRILAAKVDGLRTVAAAQEVYAEADRMALCGQIGGQRLALGLKHVKDGDIGTFLGHTDDTGPADADGTPGYDGGLACKSVHGSRPFGVKLKSSRYPVARPSAAISGKSVRSSVTAPDSSSTARSAAS